jgi:integrase/recombinase XerD
MTTRANDPQGLTAFKARYVEWLEVNNFSPLTSYTRDRQISRFIDWCSERSITRPVEVTKAVLESYQKHLFHHRREDGRPLSRKTQNGLLHGVRMFFRWMAKRGHILHDPGATLEMAKVERTLPKPALTISEVEKVLNAIDFKDPLGLRDRAILEVLYSTGIRRAELAKLQIQDIDAERGTVLVRQGKGKKDRVVPIGERAIAWVDKYLDEVRPFFIGEQDDGALFLTRFGTQMGNESVTEVGRKRVLAAGIKKSGSCHIWRHTAATLMLEAGADIRIIQEFLGHSYLSSTQVYTKVSVAKLKEVHAKTHPAKMKRTKRG